MKIALAWTGLGACAVTAATYIAWSAPGRVESGDPVALVSGTAVSGALDIRHGDRLEYVLDLPADAVTARFDVAARGADLVVSLRRGKRVGEDGEADLVATAIDGRIPMRVDRLTDPPIRAGRWYVRIEGQDGTAPVGNDGRAHSVPFTLLPRYWRADTSALLEPARRLEAEIPAREAGCRTFRVDVPADAHALRLDVVDADADVDLYAAFGVPALRFEDGTRAAAHAYGRETLVIEGADARPGSWFVDVVAPWDDERAVRFTLLATFLAQPPPELLVVPELPRTVPRATPELARALAAVVEITTEDGSGSGTFVGDAGWILTNAHVVEGAAGVPLDEVVVGCTLVPERPSIEMFRARVVRFDAERDLALVRVATGFYGQPLPEGYRFPTLEIGDASALLVGSSLWLVGYPATGGEGSRVTIHATRGIVSGFERGPLGSLVKTDAEITQGNSGGAALDGAGRLVGIPSSTVENGSGQSGFVRPVGLVPAEWLELLARPR
ncbi:MAG: serine protease [Planctomycetota bacterium]|nr:serine protease [Planctomycetota bacterium]